MGAGKSFFAKKLGAHYNIPVFDTDSMIEAKEGVSVSGIFARADGEMAFRQMERHLLQETAWPGSCVVSCGGGLPCFFDNMEFMVAHGLVVWINPLAETITARLWEERESRPLVAGCATPAELMAKIEELLSNRAPYYNMAHLVWDGQGEMAHFLEKLKTIGM